MDRKEFNNIQELLFRYYCHTRILLTALSFRSDLNVLDQQIRNTAIQPPKLFNSDASHFGGFLSISPR